MYLRQKKVVSTGLTTDADTTADEHKIDAATTRPCYGRMYKLYGLTDEEIAVVEGK